MVDWGTALGGQSAQIAVYNDQIDQLFVGHWGTGQASTTEFTNDAWHHAVWVRTGGLGGHAGNELYIDGRKVPLDINVGSDITPNVTADPYDIGGRGSGSRSVESMLDDVRIYNRKLQEHEIAALASGHMPATSSGTYTLDANIAIANDLVLASGDLDVSGTDYSVILSGSWLNYGGQFSGQDGTVTFEGASGTETLLSGGQAFTNVTVNNSSTWSLADLLDIDGTLTLSSGTIDASTSNYSLHTYDFDQSGGTFTARSGLVVLDGSSNATSTITSTLNELQIEDPTEDGLVGYWKFDECQTDTVTDLSGNGNTGTFVGEMLWTGSSLPPAIDFDNICLLEFSESEDFVRIEDDATLDISSAITFAAWVRPDSFEATFPYLKGIISKYQEASANGPILRLGDATSGNNAKPSFYVFKSGTTYSANATSDLSANTWYHLAGTYDGANVRIYVDGIEEARTALTGSLDTNNNYISIGNDYFEAEPSQIREFDGLIDDTRIYNRALSPIEIRRLANGQYADGQLSTATVTLGGNLDLDTMTILSGKLSAGSNTIDVSGDWNNYAGSGSFIEGTSTVDLDGSSTQNVRGSTEFYNLEASTTSAQTILFGSGTTQFITNAITLTGAAGQLLTVGPLTTAINWLIDLGVSATQSVSYVSVSYSDASGGEEIDACSTSTDGGNTTNWDFVCAVVASATTGNGGWRSNKQTIAKAQGSGSDGGKVAQNDTESPTLAAVGIADSVIKKTFNAVGGILDPSMRTFVAEDPSRRVKEVFDALVRRFNDGIIEFRTAQNEAAESLLGAAPDDTERRMMRADRKVADRFSDILTADAIGERRGLLVATVKSEQVVFADVPVDSWFAPFVSSVISEEIATGYEDKDGKPTGQFGAVNPVTLAESLKMSLQAASVELNAGTPRNTSAQGSWSSAYVAKAESMKLDVFAPDRNVNESATRAEVVHTILQVLGLPVAPNSNSPFTDLPENHKYAKSISTAYLYGIMTGDTDADGNALGTVRPDETINRAEVSKMIALIKDLFNQ